ncbi:sirohydrochlorin chelatase [Janibacter anophelis]|uniref:sirohydrochlorin chelatase n=1 Tax=Janibacter anophelis TaxID=319054 RepID=UPI003F7D9E7D
MTTVLLAHGSPDPRHARTLERLRQRVSGPLRDAGRGETRLVYIEHDAPRPHEIGPSLTDEVMVVPMLMTPAFHARVDVPAAVRALGFAGTPVGVTAALGGDPLLLEAVDERLRAAGHAPEEPVLLVAGGSSSGQAGQSIRTLLDAHPRPGWLTMTLAAPRAGATTGRVVVPATLAEGVLHDKVRALAEAAGSPFVPGGLADTDALARLVVRRALG